MFDLIIVGTLALYIRDTLLEYQKDKQRNNGDKEIKKGPSSTTKKYQQPSSSNKAILTTFCPKPQQKTENRFHPTIIPTTAEVNEVESEFMFKKIPIPKNENSNNAVASDSCGKNAPLPSKNNNSNTEKTAEDREYEIQRLRFSANAVDAFGVPISNILLTREEFMVNYQLKKARKEARRQLRQQQQTDEPHQKTNDQQDSMMGYNQDGLPICLNDDELEQNPGLRNMINEFHDHPPSHPLIY